MYDFAILGGAFNPIHNGHLYIAQEIIKQEVAQEVIFIPNGQHPLKNTPLVLPYKQRFTLIESAIADYPNLSISNLDCPDYGISYTFHLIKRLKSAYPNKDFTFVIGYDNALNFAKWYEAEWLLNNTNFTVVSRNSPDQANHQIDSRFNILTITPYDISSTEIRQRLERHSDISHLVPHKIIPQLIAYWKNLRLASHQ